MNVPLSVGLRPDEESLAAVAARDDVRIVGHRGERVDILDLPLCTEPGPKVDAVAAADCKIASTCLGSERDGSGRAPGAQSETCEAEFLAFKEHDADLIAGAIAPRTGDMARESAPPVCADSELMRRTPSHRPIDLGR